MRERYFFQEGKVAGMVKHQAEGRLKDVTSF